MQEKDLYPGIRSWAERFLRERHPRMQVVVEDTSRSTVRDFLHRAGLSSFFPETETFEIAVDITGAAYREKGGKVQDVHLMIVEVKLGEISLRGLSQLLGYARVVRPFYALIVSPQGWSKAINRLVNHFGRTDILEYMPYKGKGYSQVVVARWNLSTQEIRPGDTLLPNCFPTPLGSQL